MITERTEKSASKKSSRRQFLGRASLGTAAVGILAHVPAFGQSVSQGGFSQAGNTGSDPRVAKSFALRIAAATKDAAGVVPPPPTDGGGGRGSRKTGSPTQRGFFGCMRGGG